MLPLIRVGSNPAVTGTTSVCSTWPAMADTLEDARTTAPCAGPAEAIGAVMAETARVAAQAMSMAAVRDRARALAGFWVTMSVLGN